MLRPWESAPHSRRRGLGTFVAHTEDHEGDDDHDDFNLGLADTEPVLDVLAVDAKRPDVDLPARNPLAPEHPRTVLIANAPGGVWLWLRNGNRRGFVRRKSPRSSRRRTTWTRTIRPGS